MNKQIRTDWTARRTDWTDWMRTTLDWVTEFGRVFVYLKCESIGYWYIVVICQNQLIIFIHARSTTIADYSSINCLLQTLVFLAKIEILSIVSGSKNSNFLDYFLLTHHMKRYLTGLFIWHIDINRIRFSSIPLIHFILLLFIEIDFILSRNQFDVTKY